ncbi:MAG: permease-like cell division protein FtsX [Intestinibaculum porci]|uniref:permease-like cell division protein FtsX n=1 Tax=Intestinibaculum porci TaxID=2487118 RepID=UPI003F11BA65
MEFLSSIRNLPNHCKSALQNIWRNGVMSISSIFAVTITLLLIAILGIIAINVNKITLSIENSLTIYVKVDREATNKQAKKIGEELNMIEGVKKVTYSSKEQELNKLINSQSSENKKLFATYKKDNPLGDAYQVEVKNAKNIATIAKQIEDIPNVNEVTYGGSSTSDMVNLLEHIRNGGAIFALALTVVVLFMIANTIKMAITSRSTEIAIMRMVGASNWYIRLPFMLEGVFIGLFGSIIPIIVLYYGYSFAYDQFTKVLSSSVMVLEAPFPFIWHMSGILVLLGCGVGLIGSFFSVRKFLKF